MCVAESVLGGLRSVGQSEGSRIQRRRRPDRGVCIGMEADTERNDGIADKKPTSRDDEIKQAYSLQSTGLSSEEKLFAG